MAAVVAKTRTLQATPFCVQRVEISTIQAGAKIVVSHGGPAGVEPVKVHLGRVVTEATSGSPVRLEWVGVDATSGTDTIDIRLDTDAGGDLTGAVVQIMIDFSAHASAGLSNVS